MLANALRNTANKVQASLDEKQADRLRKLISLDADGQPESLTWECRLPSGDGGERTYNILRLPWASLYQPQRMVITELSLEFGCKIKKNKQQDPNTPQEYMIIPTGLVSPNQSHQHKLKLMIRSKNDYTPELTIDEQPVDDYLDTLDEQLLEKKRLRRKIFIGVAIITSILTIVLLFSLFIKH